MRSTIKLAWMYPDLLNLHGERANAMAFERVAKNMGIKLKIERIDDLEQKINFDKYDILLFNAGELKTIQIISEKLNLQKEEIEKFVNDNKIILVTGTSGAIFANKILRKDKSEFNGLGIFNIDIEERNDVIGDDLYYKFKNMEIMGSQIQMINVNLKNEKPFGKVIYGYGNNGSDTEGAIKKNLFFTNALGPLLVKNPWFCEYLIKISLKNKKIENLLKEQSFDLEKKSLLSNKEFITKKIEKKK